MEIVVVVAVLERIAAAEPVAEMWLVDQSLEDRLILVEIELLLHSELRPVLRRMYPGESALLPL